LDVNIFHTSPTAIRMLRKAGSATSRKKYNYHFKHMTTVGEPIEPDRLALVLRSGGQRRSRDRGHLVADGNRRLPCAPPSPRSIP
jgi:hypothetical protein